MVTIIMPAYNCEKYLRQAVKSVLDQSCQDWELLIIDDCSEDGTLVLAENLAALDSRITVLQNEHNLGVGGTRNHGIKAAAGEWIAFLDSDDIWEPEKLKKQFELVEKVPSAKLLYTGSAFIRENGDRMDYILHVPEKITREELLKQNLLSCSSSLVKRDLLLKYPMPERKDMHEDFAVWLRILEEEKYAYGIDEPLLIYRRSEGSKSGNKLKAAKMNWNTYRYVGLNLAQAVYSMAWYTIKGILKYKNFL